VNHSICQTPASFTAHDPLKVQTCTPKVEIQQQTLALAAFSLPDVKENVVCTLSLCFLPEEKV